MQVIQVEKAPLGGGLNQINGTIRPVPLAWCMEHGIPWVIPHRVLGSGFSRCEWMTQGVLAAITSTLKTDIDRCIQEMLGETDIAEVSQRIPEISMETLLVALMGKGRMLYSFEGDSAIPCTMVEDGISVGDLKSGKVLLVSEKFVDEVLTRDVGGERYASFGLKPDAFKEVKQVVVRIWPVGFRRIGALKSAIGRLEVDTTKFPHKIVSSVGPYFNVGTEFNERAFAPIGPYIVTPLTEVASFEVGTVLAKTDCYAVPRSQMSGQITQPALTHFFKRHSNVKVTTVAEIAEHMGSVYQSIEDALIKALGSPRTVARGVIEKGTQDVSSLPGVQQALGKFWQADATSEWLAGVFSRVAVVLHSRGAAVFEASYRSNLFTPAALIESIMSSGMHSTAAHLQPLVLIGIMDQGALEPTGMPVRTEGSTAMSPLMEIEADDLFG